MQLLKGKVIQFHTAGGEWSAARPGRTLPPGKTRYPFYRRLGGPKARSGRAENLVSTGIRSRNVQPIAHKMQLLYVFIQIAVIKIDTSKVTSFGLFTGHHHNSYCLRFQPDFQWAHYQIIIFVKFLSSHLLIILFIVVQDQCKEIHIVIIIII